MLSQILDNQREWVQIQTKRPLVQQYNNQIGEVVGRLRMASGRYTHVIVKVGKYSPGFDPSELVPVKSSQQKLSSPKSTQSTGLTFVHSSSNFPKTKTNDSSQTTINFTPSNTMDEQTKATSDQNRAADEVLADPIENSSLSPDGDGLRNRQSTLLDTEPYSADTDRDGSNDRQKVLLETDSNSLDTNREGITNPNELLNTTASQKVEQTEEQLQQIKDKQSLGQEPLTPSLDAKSEQESQGKAQLPALKPDVPNNNTSETEQPTFINILYQRLQERSSLDLSNATLLVQQGTDTLYRGTFQASGVNIFTPEYQDLCQKALDDPTGLKGELKIDVNGKTIFYIEDGELKIDSYKLARHQQIAEAQPQKQAQSVASQSTSQPSFDASAAYNRYQQEVQGDAKVFAEQPSIDAYERIAQKALNDGLSQEQVKQVLKQDPFHQNLTLSIGQKEADRFTEHLLNSLGSQAKIDNPVAALENRVQNLESFNQHLTSQLEAINQKLDRLSSSKAFRSHSPKLNQFLGNVREFISNTWQVTKNALRQKAGEVSMSLVSTLAKTTNQWFGEPAQNGLRVIDATNGQRLGVNQSGTFFIAKSPAIKAESEYQRLSQRVDSNLPPSIQVKQIAMAALKEQLTPLQIQSILSQSPKFQEITEAQGVNKANQFAHVAIAAAQRQNAIDAQPNQQRSSQKQNQYQA